MSAPPSNPKVHPLIDGAREVQEELRQVGLQDRPFFVATRDFPNDGVHRALDGGLIIGVRSLHDLLNRVEKAIENGLQGVQLAAPAKVTRAGKAKTFRG